MNATAKPTASVVKTFDRDNGRCIVVHVQAGHELPTWELTFYVEPGRAIEFLSAAWVDDGDGGSVECDAKSSIRRAALRAVWKFLVGE